MLITTFMGWVNIHFPMGMYKPIKREGSAKPPNFYRNMLVVGSTRSLLIFTNYLILFNFDCRFLVVFLGLLALKYVAVSFTETIKSSAPIFTVFISRLLLGEKNGIFVQMSLLPIMSGLALCSAYELGFHIYGFLAALGTNVSEWYSPSSSIQLSFIVRLSTACNLFSQSYASAATRIKPRKYVTTSSPSYIPLTGSPDLLSSSFTRALHRSSCKPPSASSSWIGQLQPPPPISSCC